ncbi:hypothetical protein BCSJ1_04154 [Bacillus cereus SJ1]|nr:hypothetical protein BCSJ1_04154 [Bacillus cereus SJ1]
MKYMHRNGVVMLTIFLCITACSSGERIKEISDMEPSDFKKYAGTYVGNHSVETSKFLERESFLNE